jgi:hypothetical protein
MNYLSFLIFCKLKIDFQINNKLHILNLHYYKLIFQNFLKFYFEIKFFYLYAQKKNCIIHKHSFPQIKCTCNLIFNEYLLQL